MDSKTAAVAASARLSRSANGLRAGGHLAIADRYGIQLLSDYRDHCNLPAELPAFSLLF
jgi:hypothetical protein